MPFTELNGVRLFYTDDGEGGPPVLFVHGWTCDSLDWSWQLDAFAAAHRVIAVDIRGHGRSSANGDYRIPTYAADLSALMDELGIGPVVAIGHSLGGLIVSALAVEHAELVRAAVVVDPAYGIDAELAELVRGMATQMRGPDVLDVTAAAFAGLEGPATSRGLVAWHRRRLLGAQPDVVTQTFLDQFEDEDQFALRPAADEYLRRRACPVLSVWSDSQRSAWEPTTFRHPYSRAICWEGCGHWLHQERPAEFNALVLDWIAGLP